MVSDLWTQEYTNKNTKNEVRNMSRRRVKNPVKVISISLHPEILEDMDNLLHWKQSRSKFIASVLTDFFAKRPNVHQMKTNVLLHSLINQEDVSDSFKEVLKVYLDETFRNR